MQWNQWQWMNTIPKNQWSGPIIPWNTVNDLSNALKQRGAATLEAFYVNQLRSCNPDAHPFYPNPYPYNPHNRNQPYLKNGPYSVYKALMMLSNGNDALFARTLVASNQNIIKTFYALRSPMPRN